MEILDIPTRNAILDELISQLDGGVMEFRDAGDVEVATCTFGTPAFPVAAAGQSVSNALTKDSSATGGTVDHVVLKTAGGTVLAKLTCAVAGAEILISTITVGAGDEVDITVPPTLAQPDS